MVFKTKILTLQLSKLVLKHELNSSDELTMVYSIFQHSLKAIYQKKSFYFSMVCKYNKLSFYYIICNLN